METLPLTSYVTCMRILFSILSNPVFHSSQNEGNDIMEWEVPGTEPTALTVGKTDSQELRVQQTSGHLTDDGGRETGIKD